jgi:hypothetical protein
MTERFNSGSPLNELNLTNNIDFSGLMMASPRSRPSMETMVATPKQTRRVEAATSGSSPEQDDFVMVPANLAMDSAEIRKVGRPRGLAQRPASFPIQLGPASEPMPVPSQKANFVQLQQGLVRSRSRSGDSVASAMSGVSSASSILGPLHEEGVSGSGARPRCSSVSSGTSPAPTATASDRGRRATCPPATMPDIAAMSPPPVQFTMGTPPCGHRRRTSSSSSCGTPPPAAHWQVSPNSPVPAAGVVRTLHMGAAAASPIRRTMGSQVRTLPEEV